MSAINYYLNQAAPKGSAFYYSLLSLNPKSKLIAQTVQAFYLQLIDIVYQTNEAQLAQVKFAWWREQLSLFPSQQLSHPLSLQLSQLVEENQLQVDDLRALIDGVEEKIHMQPFMNFEELTIHVMRTVGLKEKIILQDNNVEIIYQLAMIEELVALIQNLRRDVAKGIIFFPVDELDKFAVTVTMLKRFKTTEQIKNFLSFQAERVENLYNDVNGKILLLDKEELDKYSNAKIQSSNKDKLRSLRARAKMAFSTLQEIKKEGFLVLEQETRLTPLRLWWTSLTL